MIKNVRLAQMLYNTPLMIDPSKAEVIASVFENAQLNGLEKLDSNHDQLKPESSIAFRERKPGQRYDVTESGIAVIPAHGSLMHRAYGLDAMSGMVGYNLLSSRINAAAKDSDVAAILIDSDSPGGMVSGLFSLTDEIKEIDKNIKPVWSIVNESSFSASYAISSSTRRIVAPRTAQAGSIGVIVMHANISKFNEKKGVKYTAIHAGKHKNDYTPHAELKKETIQKIQKDIDELYTVFVDHVAAGRPMTSDEVRATQAAIFNASEAQEIGLIDDVMSFDQAIQAMTDDYSKSSTKSVRFAAHTNNVEQTTMTAIESGAAPAQVGAEFTQSDLDKAKAEGVAEGAKQERDRVSAILNCGAAKDRQSQAATIALETDMSAEQAATLLDKSPVEKVAQAAGPGFEAAMSEVENPAVGASEAEDQNDEDAAAASILQFVKK